MLILTVFIIILISVLCPLRDHSNPRDSRKVLRSAIENRWLFRPTSILRYMGTTEKICPRVNHTTNVLSKSIVSVFLFILINPIDISVIFFVSLIRQKLFFKSRFRVLLCIGSMTFDAIWSDQNAEIRHQGCFFFSHHVLHYFGTSPFCWIRLDQIEIYKDVSDEVMH